MFNASIQFSQPWLLLLIVPALALTLIPYFRLSKRYRKTRNRITSIVLHLIIMTLAISVLAGATFEYDIPNEQNEIILLVDVSDTQQSLQQRRDDFVKNALSLGKYDKFKIGIVTFGFDQVYAVPLTHDVENAFDTYTNAKLPDTSATDIAAALNFARSLFNYPKTSKIVLVTDGKETDEKATTAIRSVVAQETKVDVVNLSSFYGGDDVQIMDVVLPDYHVNPNEECYLTVNIQSSSAVSVVVEVADNNVVNPTNGTQTVELVEGLQQLSFKHVFEAEGFHALNFAVTVQDDALTQNNSFCSYMYLERFNNVLILEPFDGESTKLKDILLAEDAYTVTVLNINTSDNLPQSVDDLRMYDQIILNNIANQDLISSPKVPIAFDQMIQTYVNDFGGGLLTVGGKEQNSTEDAHAYDRLDLRGTLYQAMLPVQAINYTPPLGVFIIIDNSGSMNDTDDYGVSRREWAKTGAATCLSALSERDYIGVMTFGSDYEMILPLTPRTREVEIRNAIAGIKDEGADTVFPGAIDRAGQALIALKQVDKRHIIIISDGEVPPEQLPQYGPMIEKYYNDYGITLSVIGVGMSKQSGYDINTPLAQLEGRNLTSYEKMLKTAIWGHGRIYTFLDADLSNLASTMREDLNVPQIKDVNYEPFYPIIEDPRSPVLAGVEISQDAELSNRISVLLNGFFGVKLKTNANLILKGDYEVPIYAQWKYGSGMVGSFMCDLNGVWSNEFVADANGIKIIKNIVNGLLPVKNIRPSQVSFTLNQGNYINQMSVYADLNEGESINGKIEDMSASSTPTTVSLNTTVTKDNAAFVPYCFVTQAFDKLNNFSRCDFVVTKSGVYKITLTKTDADGNEIEKIETYKAFSYSKEYDFFVSQTEEDLTNYLSSLATRGNGVMVDDVNDPAKIFDGFVTHLHIVYDLRFVFAIICVVLFLLDIAVRKFKFKWLHEIIREYKQKKSNDFKNDAK